MKWIKIAIALLCLLTTFFQNNVFGATLTTTLAVSSKTLVQNMAATAFTPVTATGGTTPYTYAASPALPNGLTLDTATGQISGTPTIASSATNYTITVTDAASQTSSKTFSLTITAALVATQAIPSTTLTRSTAATGYWFGGQNRL